jgi:hypothetical protein
MSPDEHAERLRYDVDALLKLQLSGWSDEVWSPVAEALAEYGYAVMAGWLVTGKIYAQVKAIGKPVTPCPHAWMDDEAIQTLADETVALAIRKFKKVLFEGAWKAERGASLATYFVGQCKIQFPNVYRKWHLGEEKHRTSGVEFNSERVSRLDPALEAIGYGGAEGVLEMMAPLVAQVFRLKFLEGYTYPEIADMVEGVANAKAAENMVTRERARWKTRRAG